MQYLLCCVTVSGELSGEVIAQLTAEIGSTKFAPFLVMIHSSFTPEALQETVVSPEGPEKRFGVAEMVVVSPVQLPPPPVTVTLQEVDSASVESFTYTLMSAVVLSVYVKRSEEHTSEL